MKKIFIITSLILTVLVSAAYAYNSNKPDTHDSQWVKNHGEQFKADPDSCKDCHTDKVECITCHQEVKPRSHNASWKGRTHAMKARWDREACLTCHKEDSCVQCHTSTPPISHRPGWGGVGDSQNRHCGSCHYPVQDTTCYTCHQTSHSPQTYK